MLASNVFPAVAHERRLLMSSGIAGGAHAKALPAGQGGLSPPGFPQGTLGSHLPPTIPTLWKKGGTATVSWALMANHGGGCECHPSPSASCMSRKRAQIVSRAHYCIGANSHPSRFKLCDFRCRPISALQERPKHYGGMLPRDAVGTSDCNPRDCLRSPHTSTKTSRLAKAE